MLQVHYVQGRSSRRKVHESISLAWIFDVQGSWINSRMQTGKPPRREGVCCMWLKFRGYFLPGVAEGVWPHPHGGLCNSAILLEQQRHSCFMLIQGQQLLHVGSLERRDGG